MLRGVIYARYSAGPNQTDRSIEGQIDDCQAFARSNSIDIIKVYADRHISGRSTEGRYELERLIADAKAHKFDVVICWKVDRLGRDRYDLAKIKATIKRTGVLIKYAKETLPDGPEGIILESLLEGMAEYYSADLSQKVTRGLKNAAKKGQYPAGVLTYGYTKDADKHVIEDPETRDAVITVFRMYAAGASMSSIIEWLRDNRFRPPRAKRDIFSSGTIYRMLANERYHGKWSYMDEELEVKPMIDDKTWNAAQHRLKNRGAYELKTKDYKYILSGKCTCGYCGAKMLGHSGKGKAGKTYRYYKCEAKTRDTKRCECKPVKADLLEERLLTYMYETVLSDDMIEKIVEEVMRQSFETEEYHLIERYEKEIAEKEMRITNLTKALSYSSAPSIVNMIEELTTDVDALKAELSKVRIQATMITPETVRLYLVRLKAGQKNAAIQASLIKTFLKEVRVYNDSIVAVLNLTGLEECSTEFQLVDYTRRISNTPTLMGHMLLVKLSLYETK